MLLWNSSSATPPDPSDALGKSIVGVLRTQLFLAIQNCFRCSKIKRMKIVDIVNRTVPPQPWVEGDKIPWDEPGFSERMLKEHLSQDHNTASRRFDIVHRQVDYLERIAGGLADDLKVLDLVCGPGFHSLDLARRGTAPTESTFHRRRSHGPNRQQQNSRLAANSFMATFAVRNMALSSI